ncbi:MAG: phosphoserine phosphatase, partial [Actinomycetales bacterium]
MSTPAPGHVPTLHLTEPTVLVTFSGPDRSGVSTRVFSALDAHDVEVIDVEQLVVRGRLVLSVLVTVPDEVPGFETDLASVGADLGL